MKLDAFDLRGLQNIMAAFTLLEAEGVTDLRIARQRVQQTIDARSAAFRQTRKKIDRIIKTGKRCPQCGAGMKLVDINRTGLDIVWACSGKCGYSDFVGSLSALGSVS